MPAHPTTRPRPRPLRRVLALLAALTAVAALALPTTGAAAGPSRTADRIVLSVDGLDLPSASGTPDLLVSADEDFAVTVTLLADDEPAPYSTRTATEIRVTVGGRTLASAVVPAGQSSATVGGLRLPAANAVSLTASAVARKAAADLLPSTVGPFDVVLSADTVTVLPEDRGTSLFISTTKTAEPCQATPEVPTCVDVLLPNGVDSDVFFSTGLCTGDIGCLDPSGTVLQVLADLSAGDGETATPLYSREAPATLIVRCDKTRCGGGAIQSNALQVNLEPTGDLTTSPACSAKGFMSGPDGHCVDYVQSKRDGSGDTYLYLLITRDARLSH